MTRTMKILDRLWLWGMKPNVLQETPAGQQPGWRSSTMNVEQAIQRTGIRNVYMAGGLEINEQTLASMPSAQRIVCKWSLHKPLPGGVAGLDVQMDLDPCTGRLLAAKRLAAEDRRVESFLVDDFSTGSVKAGITPDHLARFQYLNATNPPHLPLYGTIYTMSLEEPCLPALLRYFDQLVVPLWHATEIETLPQRIERCAELSGNKPMLVCLYFYDFGNGKQVSREGMQRQLAVVEPLLHSQRIAGLLFCGTCMMDLGWESVEYVFDWIKHVGDDRTEA